MTFTGSISIPMNIQGFMTGEGKHCTESEGAGMKEYIERAALKRELAPYEGNDFSQQMDVMLAIVDAQPAADVAPVRHGRWEPGNPICPVCGENKFKDLDADVWADWQPKFCPNCGSRMDKEDDHEIG